MMRVHHSGSGSTGRRLVDLGKVGLSAIEVGGSWGAPDTRAAGRRLAHGINVRPRSEPPLTHLHQASQGDVATGPAPAPGECLPSSYRARTFSTAKSASGPWQAAHDSPKATVMTMRSGILLSGVRREGRSEKCLPAAATGEPSPPPPVPFSSWFSSVERSPAY